MVKEKILDTLSKLIAHRDSAFKIQSFGEAEAFAAKINDLLLKHKLSMSEVETHEQDEKDPFGKEWCEPKRHGFQSVTRRVWWQEQLAYIVAEAHFCKILVSRYGNSVMFVGREHDRQVTVYLYTYLVRVLGEYGYRISRRERDKLKNSGDENWRGWLASFYRGAIAALRERFREMRSEA